MTDLIVYTTDDGRSQLKLRAKDQTVWLTQCEMAQLFDLSTFQGLFLEINLASEKLGRSYSDRHGTLCTIINKIAAGLLWRSPPAQRQQVRHRLGGAIQQQSAAGGEHARDSIRRSSRRRPKAGRQPR